MALELDISKYNGILDDLDTIGRVKLIHNISPRLLVLTSGGKKFPLLPNLMKKALPQENVPLLFIDIGCYDLGTYRAIDQLTKEYDVKVYNPDISLRMDEALFGERMWEKCSEKPEEYGEWCIRRKETPLRDALNDLKPDFIIGGRTKFQSSKRGDVRCLERRGDIFQFNPIFDWSEDKINLYMSDNNLVGNATHFDPTKEFDNGECPIWFYQI